MKDLQARPMEQSIPPYGPLSLEMAKTAMAAAEGPARRSEWNLAIAIIDSGGQKAGADALR
jgi:uncharacterized protein GlcG (DUF336 family)